MSADQVLATAALVRNRLMLALTLLAAVFAGISVLLTSRRIMAPLALISRVLAARQQGDAAARVQLSANDALDKLGSALNRSFDDIDALTQARAERDRRSAELFHALRESEERYRLLVDGVADYAIYMLDLEGLVVNWNAGAERITGYAAGEIRGRHFSVFYAADAAVGGAPARKLEAAPRLGRYEEESLHVRKDGSIFWASVVITAVHDGQGLLYGFSKVTRDISERRRGEESVRLAAKRYEDLVQNATLGIWVLQDDRVVLTNHAARRILGQLDSLPAPERSFYDAIHPDDKAAAARLMALHADGKDMGGSHQLRVLRADGTLLWLEVSGVGTNWNDRDATLWFGTDITGRRNTEEQLREVQKLEAIGQLTAGLAHDFNNLLGIVVGNLDEIGDDLPPSGRVRQQHTAALDAALRGAEVTRSLLAVARRQPLEVKSYDLNALVVEMLPLLNASAGSAVKVLSQFAPGSMMARLDAGGLSNVVLNLTINARDAMQDMAGERVLTLRTRREHVAPGANAPALAPGWYAVLEVCDNGHGMSQSVREQAFEPFFTTKERGKGTGLGLAMVYGYATQLGGTAQIESAEGTGTTVRVHLPMESQQARLQEAAEAEDPVTGWGDSSPARLRAQASVLVVDDEAELCTLACGWLASLGYEVVGVHSPDAALQRLAAGSFDILFTDVVMPAQIDGVELARRAKRQQPALQVLLTSGYAQALFSDPDLPGQVLSKPYRRKELARAMSALAVLG
jgi:PAS domain S-box-containing protein